MIAAVPNLVPVTGARILVVEDNDLNLKLAQEILRLKGYATAAARSGEEGVELALKGGFDLILMDIQLPAMDGLTATRLIKASAAGRDVPVLAVSALARDEDKERAMLAGCQGYISKPYTLVKFIDAVRQALAPVAATPQARERA